MDTDDFNRYVGRLDYEIATGNWMLACRMLGNIVELLPDLASDLAQNAYDNGATKKDIASALNVRPADLRGMEKRVAS